MKLKSFYLLFLFAISVHLGAQRHEIGVQIGMSNLVGDIGRTNFVLQKPMHLFDGQMTDYGIPFNAAITYRMNFNPYQTVRLNFGYNHLQFDDKYAKEQYRYERGFRGTNSVFELDALFEYNFLPVNDEQKSMLSPYIFGGLGALYITGSSKNFAYTVPVGAGLKYKFNYNWALTGAFTFRPTSSDDVDYSQSNNIGNLKSKDWVNTASLMLSYSFGRPPCYCH